MKIYLCGMTQNDYKNIEELTSVYDSFDGLIFVDGGSTDGTLELLESRKKDGAIINRRWTNDHDFQMNEFLRQGPMKIGDWFFIRDSRERFNPEWIKNVKFMIEDFKKNNIRSVYNYGKGLAFEYYDDMYFLGSPHWGLHNARKNAIELNNYYDESKREHTWRLKDGDGGRKDTDFIDHFAKYYFVYPRSNHLLLGNENNYEKFQKAENDRVNFRVYCANNNVSFTLDSLKGYLKNDSWKNNQYVKRIIQEESILRNFYRWHILNHNIEDIKNTWNNFNLNV